MEKNGFAGYFFIALFFLSVFAIGAFAVPRENKGAANAFFAESGKILISQCEQKCTRLNLLKTITQVGTPIVVRFKMSGNGPVKLSVKNCPANANCELNLEESNIGGSEILDIKEEALPEYFYLIIEPFVDFYAPATRKPKFPSAGTYNIGFTATRPGRAEIPLGLAKSAFAFTLRVKPYKFSAKQSNASDKIVIAQGESRKIEYSTSVFDGKFTLAPTFEKKTIGRTSTTFGCPKDRGITCTLSGQGMEREFSGNPDISSEIPGVFPGGSFFVNIKTSPTTPVGNYKVKLDITPYMEKARPKKITLNFTVQKK